MSRALPQPDFLRPTRRTGLLPWLGCATGLLVLALAAADAAEAWARREAARDLLARQAQAAPLPRPPAPDAARERRDAQASRWLQRLATPWPLVFAAAEAAAVDGVAFTGLGFDAQGQLRLEGQAPDAATALAAAAALRGQTLDDLPAWPAVTMTRLDSQPAGLRFEIQAQRSLGLAR